MATMNFTGVYAMYCHAAILLSMLTLTATAQDEDLPPVHDRHCPGIVRSGGIINVFKGNVFHVFKNRDRDGCFSLFTV